MASPGHAKPPRHQAPPGGSQSADFAVALVTQLGDVGGPGLPAMSPIWGVFLEYFLIQSPGPSDANRGTGRGLRRATGAICHLTGSTSRAFSDSGPLATLPSQERRIAFPRFFGREWKLQKATGLTGSPEPYTSPCHEAHTHTHTRLWLCLPKIL